MITWKVEVKRFYIQNTKAKRNKNVELPMIPVTVRKILLNEDRPCVNSGQMRIVRTQRNGDVSFTVSELPRIAQSIWNNPSGKCETWYIIGEKWVRTDDKSMNRDQIIAWLRKRIGNQAEQAIAEMETAEPENVAA